MPAHQIWSCHMTQEGNFENYFCPNSAFNIGKSHKISGGKLSISEVISQKPHGEVETPTVPLGLIASVCKINCF